MSTGYQREIGISELKVGDRLIVDIEKPSGYKTRREGVYAMQVSTTGSAHQRGLDPAQRTLWATSDNEVLLSSDELDHATLHVRVEQPTGYGAIVRGDLAPEIVQAFSVEEGRAILDRNVWIHVGNHTWLLVGATPWLAVSKPIFEAGFEVITEGRQHL